jgi:hypothetical protein
MLFFLVLFIKNILAPTVNGEFEFIILIIYHAVDVFRQRKFIFSREALEIHLANYSTEMQKKQKTIIYRDIMSNICDSIFYLLLLLYTVKNSQN